MNWNEIKTNFLKLVDSKKEEPSYLLKLFEKVELLEENKKTIPLTIVEVKQKGFLVKVAGLFAFLSYHHMSWQYRSIDQWKAVSPFLIGKRFFCTIHKVWKNPTSIHVDAKIHKFDDVKLNLFQEYKGIVIAKPKYGVFIDIGQHFDWEFGSFVGLIHVSNFKNPEKFDEIEVGDEIYSRFYGHNEDGKLMFGDLAFQKEWFTGELNPLIGTVQKVKVVQLVDKKEYYVNEVYKASIPLTKLNYPNKQRNKAKKLLNSLTDNQILFCEITAINKRKNNLY